MISMENKDTPKPIQVVAPPAPEGANAFFSAGVSTTTASLINKLTERPTQKFLTAALIGEQFENRSGR
jgi:hypothetical protein